MFQAQQILAVHRRNVVRLPAHFALEGFEGWCTRMEHAFKNGETAVITFLFSSPSSLSSLSFHPFPRLPAGQSFIHSFVRSFVQSFTRLCVHTHYIHLFVLCSIYSIHSLGNLPARCHSFSSLCCNFPSFFPMSSQPALLPPM